MKPSWFSLDSSSRVCCFVSGKRSVEKIPVIMKKANNSRLKGNNVQIIFGRRKKKSDIHVLHELVGATDVNHTSEANLCNDGSELTAGS